MTKKIYLSLIFLSVTFGSAFSQTILFPFNSSWKFKDDGSNQGTAWSQVGFDDSAWASGLGQFGYGDGDETQIINACGTPVQFPSCSNKYIGYYFRKTVNIPDVSIYKSFTFEMYRDDGVVVYVNGVEVYRNNMPAGTIAYNTLASANAADDGNTIQSVTLPIATSQFQSGNNYIAVEVHQSSASSGDVSWDMRLTGIPVGFTVITRGPYLQKATSTSMLVRWYTDDLTDSEVKYGTDPENLTQSKIVSSATDNHSVQLTNLTPYTKYYYSVGSTSSVLKSGSDNYFLTSPLPNAENKYTFWVTGDVGNNSARQRDVRDKFNTYMGSNVTNGWLLLGDNAYDNGTDDVYTTNFFEIYQNSIMGKTPLWPATGNHEYANSSARQRDQNIPYFSIFDLPTSGEAGGVASNSEAYYSYDYGNIHFIALDSYIIESNTYRLYDIAGPQVQWLKQDLAANTKKWTIVYFHHPPFTMGSHNSDTETELRLIRENIVPILEQYDVDLVLAGHSHDYERSKLQKGYTGLEASFNASIHDVSQSSAKYDGTANSCTYTKDSPNSLGGTVYIVAGSAGQLDAAQASFPHDAMYYSNQTIGGSVILEVEANRLDLKWLSADGVIRDNFTLMKKVNKVNNINVNLGQSVNLEASWVGQYDWGHSVETSRIVSVTPSASTTYTVTDQYQCITDTYNVSVVSTPLTITIPVVGFTQICAGSNVNIGYTTTGTFSAGNTFTLQLSDAAGSFASPTTIGTLSSTTSGTISGVIPTSSSTASSYKFRVVSSDPVFAGSESGSFTVYSLPVVSAPSQVCVGGTITLSPTTGGTWLSSDNTKATVTNAGVVTGVASGSATFTFTNTTTGCSNTTSTVTINSLPVVSAPSQVCVGGTITLSPTTGGTWLSSDNTKATVTNAGVVTGVASGSATFTFINTATGCSNTTTSVTINSLPVVSAASQVCVGGTITLSPTTGGTWLSSDNTKATVTNAGVVTGVASGNATFTFTNTTTGCSNTTTSVTINPLPIVSAPSQVCVGGTITLSPTTGGTWLSSDNTKAIVTNAGVVTGVASGNATFTFTNTTTGCSNTTSIVTINSLPVVSAASQVCVGGTITLSPTTGGTWLSSDNTKATVSNAGVVTGVASGSATFTFTNTTTGCSNTTTSVTINSLPPSPIVSNIAYCKNAIATALTATASGGHTLQWYGTNSSGGTASVTAPTPSTISVGTISYYVSQKNNTTGCEGPRASIAVTVIALPELPTVSDITYCKDAGAVALSSSALSGHSLLWYGTNLTGGTSSITPPTPSTSSVGNTDYYVSQLNTTTGCEGGRAKITVTITSLPTSPSVSDVAYCEGSIALSLTATSLSGHVLQWYGINTSGGIASTTAPTPTTNTAGTVSYYVSQKNIITGCESTRSSILVTTNALPLKPIVSDVTYCQNAISTNLTATALSGHTLLWYGNNATGGTSSVSSPIPATSIAGTTTYYVSQINSSTSCESERAGVKVIVTTLPAAPVVTDVTYCKNAIATPLTAAALSNHILQWYDSNARGGTASELAPTPSTLTVGNTDYYVSQKSTSAGCVGESERSKITVVINSLPAAPVVSDVFYCKGSLSTALGATVLEGHTLLWYDNVTGGQSNTNAPVPSTSAAGIKNYFVSQQNITTGCESQRSQITVTIKSTPTPTITSSGEGTGSVILTSSSNNGNQWIKDGVVISGAISQSYTVSSNGVYQVTTTLDGCLSEASAPFTVVITAIEGRRGSIGLTLFPIPSHDAIIIQLAGVKDEDHSEIMIFDIMGRLVERQSMKGKEKRIVIEEYPAGEYFLRINSRFFLFNARFIKE